MSPPSPKRVSHLKYRPTAAFTMSNLDRSRAGVREFLMIFLALTVTLFSIAIVLYGIASNRVSFSGSIDVGLISSIVTVAALMAVLRAVFGKGNVS
jgi:hypothetical protein